MPPDFDSHIDYEAYYSRYIGKLRVMGDQLIGLCPLHEDTQESFGANIKTGQWLCRAGCGSGNVIDFHARIFNVSKGDAVEDLIRTYNVPEEPTKHAPEPDTTDGFQKFPKSFQKVSTTEEQAIPVKTLDRFQPILDIPLQYLTKRRGWSPEVIKQYRIGFQPKGKRPAFTIPVFDEQGELVNIRTYAPDTAEKIKSWGKGHGEARLYPVSVLSEARENGNAVFLCEGEPDTLCGISKGLHCITQTAGAETWKDSFNAEFKGMDVIICYDNDEAGRKGAARVARHLPNFAKSVSVLQWPDFMAEKEDLTDWFVKYGKSTEELLELPRVAPGKSDDQSAPEPEPIRIVTAGEIIEADYGPDKPIISGILGEKESLCIIGVSGLSKSLLTLHMALAIASLKQENKLWGKLDIPGPKSTLFVQSENSLRANQRRLRDIVSANPEMKSSCERIHFPIVNNDCRLVGDLCDSEFQVKLIEMLDTCGAELLVIDPLISYHYKEENSNSDMRKTLDRLTYICDATGCAVIVVHHAGWDNTRSRGASAIVDWACNIWMLEEVRKEKEHKTFLKVKHQKSRNYDKQEPFFLDKTCYPEMLWVDRKDVNLAEDTLKWQVLTRLDSGTSQADVANILGTTKGNVSKIRAMAIQKGWFTEQNKLTQTGFKHAGYNTN